VFFRAVQSGAQEKSRSQAHKSDATFGNSTMLDLSCYPPPQLHLWRVVMFNWNVRSVICLSGVLGTVVIGCSSGDFRSETGSRDVNAVEIGELSLALVAQ
jgi:hypothetical protein